MRLYLLLVLLCCLAFNNSYAQQTLKGWVFEDSTRIPLGGIRILNTRTKLTTETDIKGKFSIGAEANDVLILHGFAYLPDTLFLIDLKPHEIFLRPQKNFLKQVDIYTPEVHTGSMVDPEFHGQSMVYQRNPDGSPKGGVIFRIWYWKKDERKRAKLAKAQHDEEVKLEIAQVFSAKNLMRYLPIKPEECGSFYSRYIPSVKAYTANEFNLLLYLDTSYKQFMKLTPEQRLVDKLK